MTIRRLLPLILLALAAAALPAQTPASVPTDPVTADSVPASIPAALPDVSTLMREVEANQRLAEAIEKNYIYRQTTRFDKLDGKGSTTKTVSREEEIFWLNGVIVSRVLKKDDKELSPDEKKKEDERIDKQVAKAKERKSKADEKGRETDAAGHEEISFARMLELGSFSNERRETINGRTAIAVDYTGDPKAKTHNTAEAVFHELAGTVWVDERDRFISRMEGHFVNNFKMGGGLLVNIRQGTQFKVSFTKINNEVWLPDIIDGSGHVRYLLFFAVDGDFHLKTSDYRKFKATSTISPTFTAVDPATQEADPPPSAPPAPK